MLERHVKELLNLMGKSDFLAAELEALRESGNFNRIRTLGSAQGGWIEADGKRVLNFCSNNYLGLANDPRLITAAKAACTSREYSSQL